MQLEKAGAESDPGTGELRKSKSEEDSVGLRPVLRLTARELYQQIQVKLPLYPRSTPKSPQPATYPSMAALPLTYHRWWKGILQATEGYACLRAGNLHNRIQMDFTV